jgi:hypothetical protein
MGNLISTTESNVDSAGAAATVRYLERDGVLRVWQGRR